MSKKDTWSYDFSWTQPYVEMQGFFTPKEQVDHSTRKELDRIASIDKQIDLMNSNASNSELSYIKVRDLYKYWKASYTLIK